MSTRHLEHLLAPRSIAVIGASSRPGSVGATVWRNLRSERFKGPVWPVNPKHDLLDGERVFVRVEALPSPPDLAVICTPPATVAGLIESLGALGTRAVIVMTAGLNAAQKQAMLDAARPHLLRVLGPNCLGLLSPHLGLNASFAHTGALPGDVAFVSQSGALVTAVLDWAKTRRLGFSHMVSLGEHADVDFGDLLDYLASDARTRSILLYIESIESPRKFMSAARAAARNKPVIVVKAGRAGKGVAAAASHTGALAGSDLVYDAAIRRAGMLRVDTLQDLFMAAETLARFAGNRDDKLTIMTNGGGAGVMAADAAALAGIALADLSPDLRRTLDQALPATWSHANPIDMIGDAPAQRYVDTMQALLADPSAGALLFMHAPTAIVPSSEIALACAPLVKGAPGRVMACWLGDAAVAEARRVFEEAGAANYATPEEAVRAFAMLSTYRRNQTQLAETPAASERAAPDIDKARSIVAAAWRAGRPMLGEDEAKALLEAYGIPTVRTLATAPNAQAAVDAAGTIGYPVALKILSPDISHKSDVGGVRLNLHDAAALRQAAAQMLAHIAQVKPHAQLTGFTVQSMASRPNAQELIVGASVDPLFGPVLMFGQGGTAVEVIADRALALPPLNTALAREMVSRTRVSHLLAGFRDRAPADMDAICDVLVALSQMLADLPEIVELDINPLWADADGVIALDARVRLDGSGSCSGTSRFAIAPYPAALSQQAVWRGRSLVLRAIRPEDETAQKTFLQRLSPDDLYSLFCARRELSHADLARLVQIDYDREMSFIAVDTASGEMLAMARAVCDPDNVEAELGIAVRSDLKRQGLGTLLLGKLTAHLQTRGTRRLKAMVLNENHAMQELAHSNGFLQHKGEQGVTHWIRALA